MQRQILGILCQLCVILGLSDAELCMRLPGLLSGGQSIGLEDLARPIGSVAHGSNETLGKINSGSYAPMSNACDHLAMISVCVWMGRTANLDARGRQ